MHFPPIPKEKEHFAFVSRTHVTPLETSFLRQGYCRLRPHQQEFVVGFCSAPDVLDQKSSEGFCVNKFFGTFRVEDNYFVVASWAGVYPQECKDALSYAGLDLVRRLPLILSHNPLHEGNDDFESLLAAFRQNAVYRSRLFMRRHAPDLEKSILPYLEL